MLMEIDKDSEGFRAKVALDFIATRTDQPDIQDIRYQAAFEAIDRALVDTITYMKARKDGQPESQNEENRLTGLWMKASQAASPIDSALADALMMKGLGWTDPEVWQAAEANGLKIGISDVQEARRKLNEKWEVAASKMSIPRWFPFAGVCFAAVTIFFLMYLLLGPPLDPAKKTTFDVLMAFCASASGAFLGGSAAAKGTIPFFKDSPIAFTAAGGIGIFVVVFLVLHNAS